MITMVVVFALGVLVGRVVFPIPVKRCRWPYGHDWKVVAVGIGAGAYYCRYSECRHCGRRMLDREPDTRTDLEWLNGERVGPPKVFL